eukprot:2296617-Prymnesium_polylepis.1
MEAACPHADLVTTFCFASDSADKKESTTRPVWCLLQHRPTREPPRKRPSQVATRVEEGPQCFLCETSRGGARSR